MKTTAAIISGSILLGASAFAGPGHNHGEADLLAVVDGQTLTVELRADLKDLIGFEREPESEEERNKISTMHQALQENDGLVVPQAAANCTPEATATEGGFHPDGIEAEALPDHKVLARWSWHCEKLARHRKLDIGIFERYPAIEKIHVVMFNEGKQNGTDLTAKRPDLKLK